MTTYLVQFTEAHGDLLPPDKWREVKATSLEHACLVGLRSEKGIKELLASGGCWGWVQLSRVLHDNGTPMAVQSYRIVASNPSKPAEFFA